MVQKRKGHEHLEEKFLNKTQEVHYQKEFKRANQIYESTIRKNRS